MLIQEAIRKARETQAKDEENEVTIIRKTRRNGPLWVHWEDDTKKFTSSQKEGWEPRICDLLADDWEVFETP